MSRISPSTTKSKHALLAPLMCTVFWLSLSQAGHSSRAPAMAAERPYFHCTSLIQQGAYEQALVHAHAWQRDRGQQAGAYHCQAMAYFKQKRYVAAAEMLERLTHKLPLHQTQTRREIRLQTVRAWRMAGVIERALAQVTPLIYQLKRARYHPEGYATPRLKAALMERARLLDMDAKPYQALLDLDNVLALQPDHSEARRRRASIQRKLQETQLVRR